MKKILKTAALCASVSAISVLMSGHVWAENVFEPIAKHESQAMQAFAQSKELPKAAISETAYRMKTELVKRKTKELTFNLAQGLMIDAKLQKAKRNEQGSLIWSGKVDSGMAAFSTAAENNPSDNTVMLVKTSRGITGTIRKDGRLFKVRPGQGGVHIVTEIDEAQMPEDHPAEYNEAVDYPESSQTQAQESQQQNYQAQAAQAPADIKILVAYSSEVKQRSADVDGLIELAIAETNQGFVNSGVNARVSLVHTYETGFRGKSFSSAVDQFKNTNDGILDEVHGKRDTYGADVAMLMIDADSGCGRAASIGARASTAFAGVDYSCATGYYSFGHELGHLLSARHNPERDSSTRPYAFGHGFQYPAGGWRTIMSYACDNTRCNRINWWSNPDKFRGGVRMGTSATHDNARVINLTAATVAGFKNDPNGGGVEPRSGRIPDLSAGQGNWKHYTLNVQAGTENIRFALSGGSGDADLYLRRGARPTLENYDCRPWKNGNNEVCSEDNPAVETWYISIHAYRNYSDVSLDWSYR